MNKVADKNYVLAHLNLYDTHAKKQFGQNFLIDEGVAFRIVESLDINKDDQVLEIGPGLGALSDEIYGKTHNLTLVEIDGVLASHLKKRYEAALVHNMDFLKYSFKNVEGTIKVVANLPYGITSEAIEKLIFNNEHISIVVLMVQKEAYDRISAKIGSKEYGPLSIFIEYLGGSKVIERVSRHCYYPEPHVDSLVFKMEFKKENPVNNEKQFFSLVKNLFAMRRKTVLNNLTSYLKDKDIAKKVLQDSQIEENKRPEQLSLKDYMNIFSKLPVMK